MSFITEVSESDATTSYPIDLRIYDGDTSCCAVVVADSPAYGRMLFLDGELQSASVDEAIYHESLVHPVMASFPGRARVLVIGGGEGATVREVLKWNPSVVDWVDIDQQLVNICRLYLNWAPHVYTDPRVTYYSEDIETILPKLGAYNVIILDLPDPDGETGYLYSIHFWNHLRHHLHSGGRIVTHTGPVRPFGSIGEGLQRIWDSSYKGGFEPWVDGFYSVSIPSFQGEWGFWISGNAPFTSCATLPNGLRVVDAEQMRQWKYPALRWKTVLSEQVRQGVAFGCCNLSPRE